MRRRPFIDGGLACQVRGKDRRRQRPSVATEYAGLYALEYNILVLMGPRVHPPSVQRALRALGRDIGIARRKRRLPVADFATRMGVSQGTLMRLEKGEAGVSIGAFAMALLALGELHRLDEILDVSRDDTGLMLDVDSLPRRIRRPRPRSLG